jgi:hypothetical protein
MLENLNADNSTIPPPLGIQTCFDKMEIVLNRAMLGCMQSHLKHRQDHGYGGGDTDFDRLIHGQIYHPEFNRV